MPNTRSRYGNRVFVPRKPLRQMGLLGEPESMDPLTPVSNLFDVAVLIAVGFLVVALSSLGLRELLSGEDVTIVKNPGTEEMEIITKTGDQIERFKATDQTTSGQGSAVGTVYELEGGELVWVPTSEGAE